MPVITLESSKLRKEQKAQLVEEFTATAAKVMNLPPEVFVVILRENELENIGSGGKLLADLQKK